MQIESTVQRGFWVGRLALLGSAAIHAVVLLGLFALATGRLPASYTVDLLVTEPKPVARPPAPEKPRPLLKLRTPPPPNTTVPQALPREPPQPVFGVTKESVTEDEGATPVPVGNTLMKEPDERLAPPSQVHAYAAPEIFSPGDLDHPPRAKSQIKPEYPLLAKRANREAEVRLRVLVGQDGRVTEVEVLSGPESMGFREAAVAAARQWVFEIPRVKGRPAAVRVVVPICFRLD
jgi:periplasmic protein TonB